MSRYVRYLIDDVRTSTENTDYSDTIGIKDTEFLRFLNDAQYRIQNLITQKHPNVFLTEKTYSVVGGQESYTLPNKAYMGNKVTQVEYSSDSTGTDNFFPLRPGSLFERNSGAEGDPIKYIRKNDTFLLVPVPTSSTGQLRVTYTHKLPKLDLRRGSVSSVTLATDTITALSLDVSTDSVDSAELDKFTRISIVDEEGNVKMRNIKVTDIDSATGVVTVDSSFTFESGETIAVGNYVVAGDYSSTHVMLDEMVERYLIAYCTLKILHRDSNVNDLQAQLGLVREMENDIVTAYSEISDDIMEIPNIISYDDDWNW
jgi:hypothetical protein